MRRRRKRMQSNNTAEKDMVMRVGSTGTSIDPFLLRFFKE
jgi:hypothetical protein